jgi:phosphate/sulfate permease
MQVIYMRVVKTGMLNSNISYGLGHIIAALFFSVFIGFIMAFVIGIAYYRFKWLDYREEDRPDIRAYEPLADTQIGIHILTNKLLPSTKFYYFGGLCSIFCFFLFLMVIFSP